MKSQPNKICEVCGRVYTPRRCDQHTCCSECRDVYIKAYKKERYRDTPAVYRPKAVCRICGKPMQNKFINPFRRSSATMHDECVFDDCEKTIRSGKSLSHIQRLRLDARGYSVSEFKEEYMELSKEKVDFSKIETGMICLN